ncbi:recombinase family protein [Streptomyces sp. NPDC048389]|uniref:recombinase family protein n=1 Tax=Streptomyces sp. NPDC048389 TaxID=3154622 RepID=UPI003455CDF5
MSSFSILENRQQDIELFLALGVCIKTRSVICLRLSLDRDGRTAIERQAADCRAWAERNGLPVRKVHTDRGRSGYKTVERKGFDAALAPVTAGVVGTLIVWKLDRLSRKAELARSESRNLVRALGVARILELGTALTCGDVVHKVE